MGYRRDRIAPRRTAIATAAALAGAALCAAGCNPIAKVASALAQDGDASFGVIYYVGGAGPVGNVGSVSVPEGMQDAGYLGYVQVFTWQSVTAAIDQLAVDRNRSKGAELADMIRRQKRRYPRAAVHIIALSAGTGVATFALERLPEDVKVQTVVFLSSSMSSRYNLTRALRRVDDALYAYYSPHDQILRNMVPMFGTVDRRDSDEGVAGLSGFRRQDRASKDGPEQYSKLHNIGYRREFARFGNNGGHTDGTKRRFVERWIAPLILASERRARAAREQPTPRTRQEPESPTAPRLDSAAERESADHPDTQPTAASSEPANDAP